MNGSARRVVLRLTSVFARHRAERELEREMGAHLALLEDEFRRGGLNAEDARRAARRAMGGVEQAKELQRDARSFAWMDSLGRDLRLSMRALRRTPGSAMLAILTLALGIGATTAVYSAFDAAFLRPLPFPAADRLVQVRGFLVPLDLTGMTSSSGHSGPPPKTSLDLRDLTEMRSVFSHVAAHATGAMNLGSGPEPLRVSVTFATGGFFATMGRAPQLGRVFGDDEATPGSRAVVVLSDRLWRTQFGADRAIVGRAVRLDTVAHEVIGVMPPDFRFPAQAQLWVPLAVPAPQSVMSAFRNFLPALTVARLAPGVSAPGAAERITVAQRQFQRKTGSDQRRNAPAVVPLQQSLIGERRTALLVLMASAGLLLIIACANAATVLRARAAVRRREIATHAVLGATRGRIVVRLLVESMLLAAAAGLLGVAVAAASVSLLSALLPPGLSGLAPLQVDARVLGFAVSVAVVTGIGFGLWPALGGSRIDLRAAAQNAGDRTFTAGRVNRSLVITQVALACVLTLGAALMVSSLRSLLATRIGMQIDEVAAARLNLPPAAYRDNPALATFVRSAVEALARSPHVSAAAAVNTLPLAREGGVMFRLDHEGATDRHTSEPLHSSPYLVVSPGYFRAMGIALLRGRDLTWADDAHAAVAVINRTMAERFWPGEDPIGKRFLFTDRRTVVGVVEDAQITELGAEIGPQVYLPIQEQPQNYVSLVARRAAGVRLTTVTAAIQAAVRQVDRELPLYAAQPMTEVVAEALAPRRLNTLLLTLFGAAALTLAAVGVYGVVACSVSQRTREIGVRMALGAQHGEVLGLILRQGLTLVVVGLAVGIAAALAATRYLEGMLFGVTARDPATFSAVAVILVVVGMLAAFVPARRAASADPLIALRAD